MGVSGKRMTTSKVKLLNYKFVNMRQVIPYLYTHFDGQIFYRKSGGAV